MSRKKGRPVPTGRGKSVGINDLFFSTTDRRGVIELSNSVFCRLADYTWERMHGRPHNLIRHPDMPGGAFRLMWDVAEAGDTWSGYVRNLSSNGDYYDVYATITAIPGTDQFLSVRQPVCLKDSFEQALGVYAAVRPRELQLREDGLTKRKAAERGAEAILEKLKIAGYPTWASYQEAIAPAEVLERERRGGELPTCPHAEGLWGERLTAAYAMHDSLNEWVDRLDQLASQAELLDVAKTKFDTALNEIARIKEIVHSRLDADAAALVMVDFQLSIWLGIHGMLEQYTDELAQLVAHLSRSIRLTRYHISTARLHVTMLSHFVVEVLDGKGVIDRHVTAVDYLERTVRDELRRVEEEIANRQSLAGRMISKLNSANALVSSPRHLLHEAVKSARARSHVPVLLELDEALVRVEEAFSDVARLAEGVQPLTVASTDTIAEALDLFR